MAVSPMESISPVIDNGETVNQTILDNSFIKNANVEVLDNGCIVLTNTETEPSTRSANSNTVLKKQGKVMLVLSETNDADVVTANIDRVKRNEKVADTADNLLDPVPIMTRSGGSKYLYADGAYSCTIESTVSYANTTINGFSAVYLTGVSGGVKNLPVGATGNGGNVVIGQTGVTTSGVRRQVKTENLDKYNRSFILPIPSTWLVVMTSSSQVALAHVGAAYTWTVVSGSTVRSIVLYNNIYGEGNI